MNYCEASFEEIYRKTYRQIYSFLYRLCHDPQTAEDLTQETYYQAYLSLGRYDGTCEISTWLCAIAKNTFFKYLRRTKKESYLIDLYVTEPEAPLDDEPGYRLIHECDVAQVRRAIRKMPSKYSEVLILRLYGELPYQEIAAKLGISENSAKVIYHRAKNMVKEYLLNE